MTRPAGPGLARLVAAAVGALAALVLGAAPALAHASLVGETPADGATVRTALTGVTVRFDENIRQPSVVIVTGPGGQRVDHGATSVLDNTASVAVGLGERGRCTLSFRVISSDGHPVSGTTTFDYQGPPGATPSSAASGSAGSRAPGTRAGSGATVWVVVGVAVALVVAAGLLLAGRRRHPPASDTGVDHQTAADPPRSPL